MATPSNVPVAAPPPEPTVAAHTAWGRARRTIAVLIVLGVLVLILAAAVHGKDPVLSAVMIVAGCNALIAAAIIHGLRR